MCKWCKVIHLFRSDIMQSVGVGIVGMGLETDYLLLKISDNDYV